MCLSARDQWPHCLLSWPAGVTDSQGKALWTPSASSVCWDGRDLGLLGLGFEDTNLGLKIGFQFYSLLLLEGLMGVDINLRLMRGFARIQPKNKKGTNRVRVQAQNLTSTPLLEV